MSRFVADFYAPRARVALWTVLTYGRARGDSVIVCVCDWCPTDFDQFAAASPAAAAAAGDDCDDDDDPVMIVSKLPPCRQHHLATAARYDVEEGRVATPIICSRQQFPGQYWMWLINASAYRPLSAPLTGNHVLHITICRYSVECVFLI